MKHNAESLITNIYNFNTPNERSEYISFQHSNSSISDLNLFTTSAENMLNQKESNSSHIMIVFGIDNFNDINACYGNDSGNELLKYVHLTLKSYIPAPNLFCQLQSDSFAIFLEDYKNIDLALLAIQLTEEISNYNPKYMAKLSFGICKALPSDTNISPLCSRALYAKRTLKMKAPQLLADYNELIHH